MRQLQAVVMVLVGVLGAAVPEARAAQQGTPGFYDLFGNPEAPRAPLAEDVPFGGDVRAFVPEEPFPVSYRPLATGAVLLLDARPPRVRRVDGGRVEKVWELHGGGFDPETAEVLDVLPGADDGVIVLDGTAGTLWAADASGRVTQRLGLFVHPRRMALGADGVLYVDDPGNKAIVSLNPATGAVHSRKGPWLSPFATDEGLLPFHRFGPHERTVTLGLVPAGGSEPEPSLLARLEAPDDLKLLDAEVIGSHEDEIFVLLRSYREGDEQPRHTGVHAVRTSGPLRGAVRSWTVPTPTNYCMDCGPDFRIGPRGDLWGFVNNHQGYRVVRYARGGLR